MMNKKAREKMDAIITDTKKYHYEKYYIDSATIALVEDASIIVCYQSKTIGKIEIINNELIFKRFNEKIKLCKVYENKNNYNLINRILISLSDKELTFFVDSSM